MTGWDLVLIGCGTKKRATPTMALDLYTGPVFLAHRAIARHVADDSKIYVLSALHGLLSAAEVVAPYEHVLTRGAARAWGRRVEAQLQQLGNGSRVLVLAGDLYTQPLRSQAIDDPLRGLQLGARRQLARWVVDHTPRRASRDVVLAHIEAWRRGVR